MDTARGFFIVCCAGMLLVGCTGNRPENLGVNEGKLAPCPDSPNCVSSQSTDEKHTIQPLVYSSSTVDALADLKRIIQSMERTEIIKETDNYLYVEFTSALMRYVDDVEFSFDESEKAIHVRSASRLGRSDLGVNRKRVEAIRAELNQALTRR